MAQRKAPNILFMIADDHRADVLGCAGGHPVQTPHLDRLIREGTWYRNCYHMGGNSPAVCAPARAALHTGNHPGRALACDSSTRLAAGQTLLGEAFATVGYDTYMVGKWHNDTLALNRSFAGGDALFLGGMDDHFHTPVQSYAPDGHYHANRCRRDPRHSSDLFADTACAFLGDRPNTADPFFLYVAFTAPHDPRTPPVEFGRKRYLSRSRPPPNYLPEHPYRIGDDRIRDELLAPVPRSERTVCEHWADYDGMVEHMDACIGRVIATLEERGELDQTLIVYTSDHGLGLGSHGLLGKQNVYEPSIKVPLILRGPGIPVGECRSQMVQTPDLFPTLCELAGIPVPASVRDAESFSSQLEAPGGVGRARVHSFYKEYGRTVVDGEWKLSRLKDESGTVHWQLFHLPSDPEERSNRFGDEALREVVARLRPELEAEAKRWAVGPGDA